MQPDAFIDPNLTRPDLLVLQNLFNDARAKSNGSCLHSTAKPFCADGSLESHEKNGKAGNAKQDLANGSIHAHAPTTSVKPVTEQLAAFNDAKHPDFEPTVFLTWDLPNISGPIRPLLGLYIKWGQSIVRNPTDVVMLTHLIIYFTTSLPSAIYLYYSFSYVHAVLHTTISIWYMGSYTLLRHQHIHGNGVLSKKAPISWFDALFPYVMDPLMGHTWNTYYYHHVKHHHVEGNGPDDLSSTIRYQRDELLHFLHYLGRFFFLIWIEMPLYFVRKRKYNLAINAAFWEYSSLATIITLARWNLRPTIFVFIIKLVAMRLALMAGNWGQHAFVDEVDPTSDFRSSVTLIDVPSNRYCFNDGYHTSHHLNPLRHWREHPVAFLKQKQKYADEHALTFCNIDFMMLTVRLLRKDYAHLAKCLVPMGEQIDMTMQQREALLRRKTRAFSEEEIRIKFELKGE